MVSDIPVVNTIPVYMLMFRYAKKYSAGSVDFSNVLIVHKFEV